VNSPVAEDPLPLERAKNATLRKGSRRFPTFEVPAGAPTVSASRIERILGAKLTTFDTRLQAFTRKEKEIEVLTD